MPWLCQTLSDGLRGRPLSIVEKLDGKTPPKCIDLAAHVIEKRDIDKPDIKQLLFPDVKKYAEAQALP